VLRRGTFCELTVVLYEDYSANAILDQITGGIKEVIQV